MSVPPFIAVVNSVKVMVSYSPFDYVESYEGGDVGLSGTVARMNDEIPEIDEPSWLSAIN